jgi:hypothetical protein
VFVPSSGRWYRTHITAQDCNQAVVSVFSRITGLHWILLTFAVFFQLLCRFAVLNISVYLHSRSSSDATRIRAPILEFIHVLRLIRKFTYLRSLVSDRGW